MQNDFICDIQCEDHYNEEYYDFLNEMSKEEQMNEKD